MKDRKPIRMAESLNPEKEYPLPDINHYVSGLARHLEIPSDARRRLEEQGETDPLNWAKEVRWAEDDNRVVKARISRILKSPITLSSDNPIPEKIDDKTPIKDALGTLAMYRAKLEFLKDNAPDFVTLPAFRLTKETAKVDRNIDALLSAKTGGGKLEGPRVRLADVISGVKKKAVLAGMALATAACSNLPWPIEATQTPLPTSTVTPEAEITPAEQALEANIIETSALSMAGLNVEVQTVIPGILRTADSSYVLAQAIWHDGERNLNTPILVETDTDGSILDVIGLAFDEDASAAEGLDIFRGFEYVEAQELIQILETSIRSNNQTGQVEIYENGVWQTLSATPEIMENVRAGVIVRAAPLVTELTPTPDAERVEGEWRMEVEGSHGTLIRLAIDNQVREREEVSLHEIRFVDVNMLEDYYDSQEGFVEALLQSWGDFFPREMVEEFTTLVWQAFPEGRAIDSLEGAFLRAVFERGREVGLFSGWNFEGYILAVEEAHRSGNSNGVSVPLTEGRIIDPTRPVTFAFIDPDVLDDRGGLNRVGSSTEEWVDYVYSLRGPQVGSQIPGHDPTGRWKRNRWQIGFDNEGGVVFAWILDEQYYRIGFNRTRETNDPASIGGELAGAVGDMLLSIQRNEFLGTSGFVMGLENCRGYDFIGDSLYIPILEGDQGGVMHHPIFFPFSPNF